MIPCRRLPDVQKGELPCYGEDEWVYWFSPGDGWYLNVPPIGLASLRGHQVELHEDATITASPSILVGNGDLSRHGFLERGVWRDA